MYLKESIEIAGRNLTVEIGKFAKQASGSVYAQYGETCVLVAVVMDQKETAGLDFLPLTVDYIEKTYSAGRFPGGFFKREGRPSEIETLTSRIIDRSIRPLFPKHFNRPLQVIATVLSMDQENDADFVALIAASLAFEISNIPFLGPIAAARVGYIDGQLVLNPTFTQLKTSLMDIIVSVNENGICMVEGGTNCLSEELLIDALMLANESLQPVLQFQRQIKAQIGVQKIEVKAVIFDTELKEKLQNATFDQVTDAFLIQDKIVRYRRIDSIFEEFLKTLPAEVLVEKKGPAKGYYEAMISDYVRTLTLQTKKRIDGRAFHEVRNITCEVGLLPRTHGSALFTRGETQALTISTLGTTQDEQRVDGLLGDYSKKFMLHYNFPPFSVGEVKPLRSPGRREIGHGALAERSLGRLMPGKDDFPYSIRVVSEVLESNGSSSMATVCGASLCLMDAGVPIKEHVAGIAMGMMKQGDDIAILSDIIGEEDHYGDMDFKITGSRNGIYAIQMDIKTVGLSREIMLKALHQAKAGRLHILEIMEKTIAAPRKELSPYAPRILIIHIKTDKIKDVIGPQGKIIKKIIEETGVTIDIDDDGTVLVASVDQKAAQMAIDRIMAIVEDAEIGKIYNGVVKRIAEYGAFVEIIPGLEGLVHISEFADYRVRSVRDFCKEGDYLLVKVIDIDNTGKIRLSHKEAVKEPGQGESSGEDRKRD